MNVNYERFTGGLVLVFIGVIFLFINYGYLDWTVWRVLVDLWPVLLILFGIKLLLGKKIGFFVTVAVLVLALGFALWQGAVLPHQSRFGERIGPRDLAERTVKLEQPLPKGVTAAKVKVEFGAGRLTVEDTTDALISGAFTTSGWRQPEIRLRNRHGETAEVEVSESDGRWWPGWGTRQGVTWLLKLNNTIPIDLRMELGAGSNYLDLSPYRIRDLHMEVGASSSYVKLGSLEKHVKVSIDAGASSMTLSAPRNSGLRITMDGALVSLKGNNFSQAGLVRSGDVYTSPNYNSAKNKIDIDISAGAASFELILY